MHMATQIAQFGTAPRGYRRDQLADHNGGSARGYQELPAPLAIPATAGAGSGQARMFMHSQSWGVIARKPLGGHAADCRSCPMGGLAWQRRSAWTG